jgi:hypothetical protein
LTTSVIDPQNQGQPQTWPAASRIAQIGEPDKNLILVIPMHLSKSRLLLDAGHIGQKRRFLQPPTYPGVEDLLLYPFQPPLQEVYSLFFRKTSSAGNAPVTPERMVS